MSKRNNFILNVQINCTIKKQIPNIKILKKWIKTILYKRKNIEIITIRIVEEKEIQDLNFKYRGKNYPTNILSFNSNVFIKKNIKLLGDLVICKSIIEKESIKYNRLLESHWAHIVIHGTLHLLGYDHHDCKTQNIMENIENKIMLSLNYNPPYFRQ